MGLTHASTGKAVTVENTGADSCGRVLLAGSPNVGKSTVFNALTGLRQHTGNWTGKTVATAAGTVTDGAKTLTLVDLPGTYSLAPRSDEEVVARDALLFDEPRAVVVVCDALALERSLRLVLQTAQIVPHVVVCVNLMDQASKKGLRYDFAALSEASGLAVIPCAAGKGKGLAEVKKALFAAAEATQEGVQTVSYPAPLEASIAVLCKTVSETVSPSTARFCALLALCGESDTASRLLEHHGAGKEAREAFFEALPNAHRAGAINATAANDMTAAGLAARAKKICEKARLADAPAHGKADRVADAIVTGRYTALPVMALLLALLFWITLVGANIPSAFLSRVLFGFGETAETFLRSHGASSLLCALLFDGVYRVTAWVAAVMLPPMAIFFPLFTLLEDVGLLPRLAYDFDRCFAPCGSCGKQMLTMCMGIGCNAAGVVGCRIIDAPREKKLAILTNSFIPCNGRLPLLVTVISLFLVGERTHASLWGAFGLALLFACAFVVTLVTSFVLSHTAFRGAKSTFVLEMPPYRMPKIGEVLVRSFLDRTLFVLGRAVMAAIPAGLVLFVLSNVTAGGASLLSHLTAFLDPAGRFLGMDGVILAAFLLGLPANEIVLPVAAMAYTAGNALTAVEDAALGTIFAQNGWTVTTAVCVLLFTLFHFPCATTLLTVRKETGSMKMTAAAFFLPLTWGFALCLTARLLMG